MDDPERGWSLSFAGCGFVGFYHVGVTHCLSERAPHLLRDARMFFGCSAGALHCAAFLAGIPLDRTLQVLADLVRNARKRNLGVLHPSFNMSKYLREDLHKHLPDNIHQLISGKLCVSLTRVSDRENVLVSDFQSKEEVVDVLVCACFIPFYCGLIPPSFRGVVLGEICLQGYLDALRFLEEQGICTRPGPSLNLSTEESELEVIAPCEENMSQEAPWEAAALEMWPEGDELLETLCPKLLRALNEAVKDRGGYMSKMWNFFPMRIMSYMMLPCTLPVESVIALVQRLVMWVPGIPDDIQWLQWVTSQIYSHVTACLLPTSRAPRLLPKALLTTFTTLGGPCSHLRLQPALWEDAPTYPTLPTNQVHCDILR
ncbi:1-acylglycerol-3-phosphate O-acyltransferase PNPLA3-like isoform X5 [Choloepus didactylus]|uniref:1-acylglycerol-3-phosphate O-acyltransferase PNPLA3-like isoform X5 n=1 Tax=Choloepus didactylus TaxID=27675 RepID=UPI00189E136B|nr:1-acylglycerol-3-phosphate O-acyltransferase PNPLA3-like isoform X5 [Choloepus didactylus]